MAYICAITPCFEVMSLYHDPIALLTTCYLLEGLSMRSGWYCGRHGRSGFVLIELVLALAVRLLELILRVLTQQCDVMIRRANHLRT